MDHGDHLGGDALTPQPPGARPGPGPRAIVVGAGSISNAWFPPLAAERVAVAAVVDLRLAAAEAQIARYGLKARASDDLARTLREVRADFLLDLTVPEAHCAVVTAALGAGLHVIGEKPMAASLAQARRMVRAAERSGRLYMVSQSRRWEAQHQAVARTVAAGRLGRLTALNCDFFIAPHFGGFRDRMPSPLVLDMAIHHFDLARMFSAADPVAVYAQEWNPRGSWYCGDAAAACIFEMTGGVRFVYRGCWCAEGCATSWNGNWRVIGDRGTLLYEHDGPPRGEAVAGRGGFTRRARALRVAVPALRHRAMHGALREMLRFLRTGRRPQTECRDNIKSLAMVFAAMESSRRGRRVPVRT